MPTFRHGKTTGVYISNLNVSPFFNSADVARTVDTHETTAFESEAKTYQAGINDGTIGLSGLYDSSATGTGADELLESLRAAEADFPASIFMDGGVAVGRACRMGAVLNSSYSVSSAVGDLVSAKADFQVDGGVRYGKCLNAKTPISGVVTGASSDYGAAAPTGDFNSSVGGFAHIHAIDNTRSTATDVKVQHSSDNSVWVDIGQYTLATATKVGLTIPTTGTNLRYVRTLITPVAGTGSATIIIAFARNAG